MTSNYDLIADSWAMHRTVLPAKDRALFEFFMSRLPQPAHILDLGCGTGVPIARLLDDSGFCVSGIDASANLLAKAKENVPNARFTRQDITEYALNTSYDGMVLWDVLFHLPREQHRPLLSKIHQALPEHGVVIVSSGGSDKDLPPFTDFMFDVEFFYDAYPVAEFIHLCEDLGFKVAQFEQVNIPDGNRDKGRIGVVLVKF